MHSNHTSIECTNNRAKEDPGFQMHGRPHKAYHKEDIVGRRPANKTHRRKQAAHEARTVPGTLMKKKNKPNAL